MIQGSVAFVTGAGRGIGRAVAIALAARGARLSLVARTRSQIEAVARDIAAMGGEAVALEGDVTDEDGVRRAFDTTRAMLGEVDVLVNNAGIAESAPLVRTDLALWQRMIAVNLTGCFVCMREALPSMIARERGRVINIASIAGRVGFPYTAAYCASKHGVLGLTRAAALEVASKGITVNAICPGWVDTDMTDNTIQRIVEKTGRTAEDARGTLERMSPMRRLVRPEEVAAAVVLLASADGAAINGQALNIDGGEVMS